MSQRPQRVLTGITTSGTPHLGNYVGAVRPAIAASRAPNTESFYFLADLHSLIKAQDPARTQRSTLEIAATWLAAGLDPATVWFYRQSDVPETTELMWLLTCVAGKGILNRAHAYKAAVDRNRADGEDDDAAVTAGLFMYPVLMAADILIFNADRVPVGRDQVQHIEMARDFAQRFNHVYGRDWFTLPEAVIDDQVALLPGLDGRKMSKSYENTIPLFVPPAQLKKLVFSILTDSTLPGEAKSTDGSALFQLYQAFATPDETAGFAAAFADGIGWGDAKQQLFDVVEREIAPMRERYEALIARPGDIEDTLREGGRRLRERYAIPLLRDLRDAVGLRDLGKVTVATGEAMDVALAVRPLAVFKQYREPDGRFYFKLVDGERVLLQSDAFEAPRDAGQTIARLRRGELAVGDAPVTLGEGVDAATVQAALAALAAADAEKAAP
ncbi:tryptophan--tRNA ligase [Luteimonas sp BLCC-B24]|uniref:tryptophan--tRNA ligase n=1 Tax=Luteimonas sp. BLCC-B24 TaxID=3025317 RepID=UPI00234CAB4B|nr:tryptophan--tRNA ligase [Luteimonas sp. BLCC-B24]MDC7807883.1 tryptophan--tRNA ligase [Luteimonas sp. BLCC-B24]